MHWSLSLQPYQFTVEHRRGVDNANADALSRLTTSTDELRLQKEGEDVADYLLAQALLPDHSCKAGPNRTGFPETTNQNTQAPWVM